MKDDQYKWPNPIDIYPDKGKKSYRMKRFRFHLRSMLHLGRIKQFTVFVNKHPELLPLLNSHPDYSYPVVHRFLDKRFNAEQRLNAICDNLTFLPNKLAAQHQFPLWMKRISFNQVIEGFELCLNINEHQPMEGFWALELREQITQELIYLLTFGKINNALLIAVIQGPNCEGSKELVKLLTKRCHGLRPAYLMVEAMKRLTIVLGFKQLLGIPQKYQNKSRLVKTKRYLIDYDTIFRESGGKLKDYWQLPLTMQNKEITEIESKKRSMYRKRYAMLDQLLDNMKTALNYNEELQ